MCGIAGSVGRRGTVRPEWLTEMAASLRHRGPDDHGFLQWSGSDGPIVGPAVHEDRGQVGLVHLRLAILDLSAAGWQPMHTPDERFWMVYNGEIYNYIELRSELEALGHTFTSTGDSEVLLAAFAQWGSDALPKLVGMYAAALLDTKKRQLTLARDPYGIKPLFYARSGGSFAFASEIKALLALPQVSRRANAGMLHDYLRYGSMARGAETFFADIVQLSPGHVLTLDIDQPDHVDVLRFAALPDRRDSELTFAEAAEQLREHFIDSVRIHLRSDVPVGIALSGGIDSSAIVAAVRAVGGRDVDLRAFSYVADDAVLTEESWIDLAAGSVDATVTKVRPQSSELARDLDALLTTQDEPFGSTSIYAQYRVFEAAAHAGIKVMLDGQGADEMLAGYAPYVSDRIATLLRQRQPLAGLELARASASNQPNTSAISLVGKAATSLMPAWASRAMKRRFTMSTGADEWLDTEWFAQRGVHDEITPPYLTLSDALTNDFAATFLPGLLRYEDRNSMAFSIESRVPFLNPRLTDFVFRLPEEYLLSPSATSKSVFREAMRGLVPDAILDRTDKIGFGTPERQWITALRPWIADVIAAADPAALPCLNLPAVETRLSSALNGDGAFGWHIWRWINVIRWAQLYDVDIAAAT